MTWAHTADLDDAFFSAWVAMCDRHGWDPLHPMGVSMSESNVHSTAKNPNADANGLIQFMGPTLKNLGWTQGGAAFRTLTAAQQVPYVEAYFKQYGPHLTSAAKFYVSCFLPAMLPGSNDPSFILCGLRGPLTWAYMANRYFDSAGKGSITVQDMANAITRACKGPRWDEIVTRLKAAGHDSEPIDPKDVLWIKPELE